MTTDPVPPDVSETHDDETFMRKTITARGVRAGDFSRTMCYVNGRQIKTQDWEARLTAARAKANS